MRFLAVDDEEIMLYQLGTTLRSIRPDAEVFSFTWPDDALEAARQERMDAAFLDIEMGAMTGLELAVKLKEINPGISIIFVTGYRKYALDAFGVHATGYLLKPVTKEALERELTYICAKPEKRELVRVQTFGGFEVFVEGETVKFARTKSKELLAYLIDRRGATVTTQEAYAALFEDVAGTGTGYFRNIVRELKCALQNAGAEGVLKRSFNSLAVATEKIDCDYYRLLEGDPVAANQYQGDYMPSYSWAESRNAALGFTYRKNRQVF
ncbi:MAG: response regulator [Lachnospiraceae bacterium]|nr:response regulator [Lachnospiraceae bacterium]